jgi:hypothetical protein
VPLTPADRRAAQRRRELNLTIAAIAKERGLARALAIACECGGPQCFETITLEGAAFDALLARGEQALAPAHAAAPAERERPAAAQPLSIS